MIFIDSSVLLKCFGLTLNKNDSGNLYLRKLCFVLPPQTSCKGKKSPSRVITNEPAVHLLSELPAMETDFTPFFGQSVMGHRYILERCLVEIHDKILRNLIFFNNSHNIMQIHQLYLLSTPSGISTLPVNFFLRANPILLNKLFAHEEESRLICSKLN